MVPDLTILVDAYPHNAAPGTVTVIEPDVASVTEPTVEAPALEPHGLDPVSVLRLAAALRIAPKRLLLVGCQPLTLGGDDGVDGPQRTGRSGGRSRRLLRSSGWSVTLPQQVSDPH